MPATLTQLLQRSATLFPDNCAFRFAEQAISYQELHVRSSAVGSYLRESGITSGDRVGILLDKSINMVIAVYGVLYAGAAYVPIDNSAPAKRVSAIVTQCAIGLVITNARLTSRIETGQVVTLTTDQGDSWLNILQSKVCNGVNIMDTDVAYIMFTSGSTNVPKGIVHTHASATAFATMIAERYDLQAKDRVLGLSPLHFDMSTLELFAANLSGACTVLCSEAQQKIATSLTQLAEHEKISIWYSTPFSLIQCLQYGVLEQRSLDKLRWIIYAGEALAVQHLKRLLDLFPKTKFSNAYGPAETNVCHTFDLPNTEWQEATIPIGYPCPGVFTKVIDEHGRQSTQGELWVSAPTMMKAYWNAPELTEKSIVYDNQGQRYYKTGDIVKVMHDDLFYFLGRKDRQVKLRGFRVELEEVETCLTSIALVKAAHTAVVNNESDIPIICADVLVEDVSSITTTEIIQELSTRLPPHAIPQKINIRSTFPLTSSGKINRRKLAQQWQSSEKAN